MPVNKKVARKATSVRRTVKLSAKKVSDILQVDQLGVDTRQIVQPASANIEIRNTQPVVADSGPPKNLPVEPIVKDVQCKKTILNHSYTSPRTSFWLGVGFGILVVGALMLIAWQLAKFELANVLIPQCCIKELLQDNISTVIP